jgi:Methyltransferase domain
MTQRGQTVGELEALFDACRDRRCHKWRHYFEIYERYLAKYRHSECVYLEIGVEKGGSLDIMARYLGDQARVIGVDISPACKQFEKKGYEIYIGDQADGNFLRELATSVGVADIIVDDGGHTPDQQITSFFSLFPILRDGGTYIVEDVHSNFWQAYNSSRYGINFFDFAKGLADKLSYWHLDIASFKRYHLPYDQRQGVMNVHNFATTQIYAIHFYDSIIVFEKRQIREPLAEIR